MHIIIRIPAYIFILFCLKPQANRLVRYIIIEWYSRARIIVSKPDTPIAMPLMAPSISPSCMARLVACDRASTTRALHKMEQDGVIELGYRCIRILPALNNLDALAADACAQFHMPPKT